jgi:hypothetical protein
MKMLEKRTLKTARRSQHSQPRPVLFFPRRAVAANHRLLT